MSEIWVKILKAKAKKKLSLDDYITQIAHEFGLNSHNEIKGKIKDLYLFILDNFKIEKDELIKLINSKIESIELEAKIDKEDIYLKIKGENGKIAPNLTSPSFDSVDFKAIKLIDDSFYWLGNEYKESIQNTLKDTIKEFMSGELSRKEIAEVLAEKFGDIVSAKASVSYFEGVADNIINQNRNLNMVLNTDEEVKFFKVMARMDNKTSAICRSMHGRIISAKHLQTQAKNLLNAKNMSEKKNAAVWMSSEYLGKSDKMPADFGLPPYHFHCRTIVVPVYLKEGENGERYTGTKGDDEAVRHIDKTGVERVVSNETFNHLLERGGKHPKDKKEIIKALNSIVKIAPHNEFNDRYVAISQNGYFMVFNNNNLHTIFKPDRKLEKYFKDSAINEKVEVIKWHIGL